jgi:hypothetical protein
MKQFLLLTVPFIITIVFSLSANSQTKDTLSPVKDNSMFQVPNRYSNGIGPEIYSGTVNNGTTLARRGLIQFSFSEIPNDALITDVQFVMYCTKKSSSGNSSNYDLHRLEESWGEESSYSPNGQGVLADTGDATWKDRFYDFTDPIEWEVQGGTFVSIPSASIPVNIKDAYYTWAGEQLIEDVQDMLDNPDDNFGWILKATDETADGLGRAFGSRENENAEKRPRLIVTYVTTTSFDEFKAADIFRVYPNPGTNTINIEVLNTATDQSYQILDGYGRIVQEGNLSSQTSRINTHSLKAGYYFIRFPESTSRTISWIKY